MARRPKTDEPISMLSYRHAFHAGSAADVLKHAMFVFVLAYAGRKPKPLYLLDTHAGAGIYDLSSPQAQRTGEYAAGIARLIAAVPNEPELVAPYLALVRAANPTGRLEAYPGSPILARRLLRPQDRHEAAELHSSDHRQLRALLGHVPRANVTREDGLALLIARLPPPERRGIVLIDPSYEIKSDHEAVVRALTRAYRRFATGTYLLWYPVIERRRVETFLDSLRASGLRAIYQVELCLRPDAPGRGMTGSGVLVVNPPWTLPSAVDRGLPWLVEKLGAAGPNMAGWLVPEGSSARAK